MGLAAAGARAAAARGAPPGRRGGHRDGRVPREGLQAVLVAAPARRAHRRQEGLQRVRRLQQVRRAAQDAAQLDGEVRHQEPVLQGAAGRARTAAARPARPHGRGALREVRRRLVSPAPSRRAVHTRGRVAMDFDLCLLKPLCLCLSSDAVQERFITLYCSGRSSARTFCTSNFKSYQLHSKMTALIRSFRIVRKLS